MVEITRRSLVGLATALPLLSLPGWSQAAEPTPLPILPSSDDALINFNESPWGPSRNAHHAMQQGIALSGRYPYKTQYRLNALFARQQGIPEDHVQSFCGSKAALQHAVMAFTQNGSLVMASPSYEAPREAAESRKVQVHEVPLDTDHRHNLPAMLAVDRSPGLIYLCNPNNPTGTLTPRKDIEQALARKPKGAVLVIDEAYIDFSEADTCIPLVKQQPELLVLRTFSKIYGMAGARLGFAVGQPALLKRLEIFGGYNVPAASTLLGGIASLEESGLLAERKRHNNQLRDETIAWLQERGFTCTASQANCFMIDVRRPAQEIVDALAAQHVKIGRVWNGWPNWARVSVGSEQDMQRFRQAFAQVTQG
ncbi:aminotransferase class I/II-fold pyridoxal phosphate-dependent enzyme [Pseudomonas sp. Fl5BN2]|uniref:pyoverdine biosynthesis transaminase PtaA n=1 Tax=Pseudomonas sp. Fl5BN2 TaxID=2697652 RepID=UPI001378919E|nr:pyridoxal phosphate-dependent aminotransferase [Pseudomonas sp. Fl5BN2]NBF05307.1 aminotransferase class I/II-fold pyridoxal phosphate-dependent enzyme [Pseudomonas sp. Fl5BN2]